jgi:hypothetical protein
MFVFLWPARDISMYLPCIGTSGRGEVCAVVSLFYSHVSKLYRRTKWPALLKIVACLGSAQWSDFCKQKAWVRASVYCQNVFRRKEVTVWCNEFKDGRKALNDDPKKHRSRPRTSRTDENCVIDDGLARKDRRVKFRELHWRTTAVQHFTFISKEHFVKECLHL